MSLITIPKVQAPDQLLRALEVASLCGGRGKALPTFQSHGKELQKPLLPLSCGVCNMCSHTRLRSGWHRNASASSQTRRVQFGGCLGAPEKHWKRVVALWEALCTGSCFRLGVTQSAVARFASHTRAMRVLGSVAEIH